MAATWTGGTAAPRVPQPPAGEEWLHKIKHEGFVGNVGHRNAVRPLISGRVLSGGSSGVLKAAQGGKSRRRFKVAAAALGLIIGVLGGTC
jgi:hypothetical protein